MKNFIAIIINISLLFALVSVFTLAQEEAKYNFGSAQSAKELTIAPGDEVTTKLYFYNIYGNRITHISLEVGEVPKNWDVSIDPPLHETSVIVSGVATTVEENLFAEPGSDVAESIPDDVPEGIEYISSPVGFVGAKPVLIKIKVPSNEKLGTVANVRIDGTASWLGQTGTAAITQSRSFEYIVTIVSKEFTETILEKAPEKKEDVVIIKETAEEIGEGPATPQVVEKVVEKEVQVGVPISTFVGVIIVLVIIGIFAFVFMSKKK